MTDMSYNEYDTMTLEQLGDVRDFALIKLESISQALKQKVIKEHDSV